MEIKWEREDKELRERWSLADEEDGKIRKTGNEEMYGTRGH